MQPIVDWCDCHASKQTDSRDRGLVSSLPLPYCANSLLCVNFIHGLPTFGGYETCLVVLRLGTFFDIQNRLLVLTSKIQTGYWFFHHIKNRLLVWTYVSKQVPVIDNLGVQLSVVQVVWTIQNNVTIYD